MTIVLPTSKIVYSSSGSSRLECQSSKQEVVSSSLTLRKNFSFLSFSLSLRASQLDKAIINEIKRDIHLAITLFSKRSVCIYSFTSAFTIPFDTLTIYSQSITHIPNS